ncbi:hypothetical protein EGW08_005389 [Elysia chlorotica]|uniref:EamA domain-containing protein n=1 Tax=Elysia chlorotica TaxID=188477 RepID=A0A3S1BM34_ELYCH|nr:hypothetical protein EGW08_005389 [Elysia chlorotica]
MILRGPLCASQAGCCAALASLSAKIATSYDAASAITTKLIAIISILVNLDFLPYVEKGTVCARLLGIAGIFLFNTLMWVLFTKSMHLCSSTLEASAFNIASNFIFTAVIGKVLFEEHLSLQWCLGSTLMVLGLAILHQGGSQSDNDLKSKRSQHEKDVKLKKT